MKIELDGANVAIVGRFSQWSHQDDLIRALELRGAVVTRHVTQKTVALLRGQGEHSALGEALVRGIPILSEEEVQRLLEDGFIELGGYEKVSSSALFGELRALLHGSPPDNKKWLAVCRLIDRCNPEEAGILVRYALDFFDSWERQGAFDELRGDAAVTLKRRAFVWYERDSGIEGELCVAPPSWLGELHQGDAHEKFELLRALDLSNAPLSSTAIQRLLTNPHLKRLRRLALPTKKPLTSALTAALCAQPWRDQLIALHLGVQHWEMVRWFGEYGAEYSALQELDVSQIQPFTGWGLLNTPHLQQIKVLCMETYSLDSFETFIKQSRLHKEAHIEELRVMNFSSSKNLLRALKNQRFMESLKVVRLYRLSSLTSWRELLRGSCAGHLDLLDISRPSEYVIKSWSDAHDDISSLLCKSRLLKQVSELKLGPLHDHIDLEEVRASHPSLLISR